ncbi:MAG: hypothetical protein WA948_09325 [Pontixanthobacter sp.]
MDFGTVIVSIMPFIMVLGIIFLINQRKMQEKQLATTADSSAEKSAQYANRVGDLENRVKVLERIVTDRGYDVAAQIEALRDTRDVEFADAGTPLDIGMQEPAR